MKKAKVALLVIDAQRAYTDGDSELCCEDSETTLRQINRLVEHFESRSAPVVLVRHVHAADGSDCGRMFDFLGEPTDEIEFVEGTEAVDYDPRLKIPSAPFAELTKTRYSAFVGTKLEALLRRAKVDTVAVCGFMTNFCCEATARQAHDMDYYVDFLVDATGTPGTENLTQAQLRETVADVLAAGVARVSTVDEYLDR